VTEFVKDYRYHPMAQDIQIVCKQFETRLPECKFGSKFRNHRLWLEGQSSDGRYYGQLLRNEQEPEAIVDRFYQRLKPKNPNPDTITQSSN
jgi:hypothetical protein